MPSAEKPSALPDWATSPEALMASPSTAKILSGHVPGERPTVQTENYQKNLVGQWIRYLNTAAGSNALSDGLDADIRLVGGGQWSFSATSGALGWSSTAGLIIPTAPAAANQFAAGSVLLADGQYAVVNANVPLATTCTFSAGSSTLTDVAVTDGLVVGMSVSGAGIASGTTITAINASQTLSISQPTTSAQSVATIVCTSTSALSVTAVSASTFSPTRNSVAIALRSGSVVFLGANAPQACLHNGEFRYLGSQGYADLTRAPAGATLTQNQAVYISSGAADSRTAGNAYPTDASGTSLARAQYAGFAIAAYAAGTTAVIASGGLLSGFTGLTPGQPVYLDPATVGGITQVKPSVVGAISTRVGMAMSATTLLVSPTGGQSATQVSNDFSVTGTLSGGNVVSGSGFKTCMSLGGLYVVQTAAGGANYASADVLGSNQASAVQAMALNETVPFAGSVVSMSGFSSGAQAPSQVSLYVNNQLVLTGAYAAGGAMARMAPKGQVPVPAGAILRVVFSTSGPGTYMCTVKIWLELAA